MSNQQLQHLDCLRFFFKFNNTRDFQYQKFISFFSSSNLMVWSSWSFARAGPSRKSSNWFPSIVVTYSSSRSESTKQVDLTTTTKINVIIQTKSDLARFSNLVNIFISEHCRIVFFRASICKESGSDCNKMKIILNKILCLFWLENYKGVKN